MHARAVHFDFENGILIYCNSVLYSMHAIETLKTGNKIMIKIKDICGDINWG